MHGEEVDARPDPGLVEEPLVLVARAARPLRVDADDVQVQRVDVARVARQRLDAVELGDPLVVQLEVPLADRRVPIELVELAERDRGQHVGEVRLVAGHRDVVQRAVAAAHQAQPAERLGDVVAVGGDEPALARGHVLRRVQREARRVRQRPDLAAAVDALHGVRGVLDHRDPEREDRVHVARPGRPGAPA